MNIKQDEADRLLNFSLAHWAFYWVFNPTHVDSTEKADAELAVRAIPVCTSNPFAAQ